MAEWQKKKKIKKLYYFFSIQICYLVYTNIRKYTRMVRRYRKHGQLQMFGQKYEVHITLLLLLTLPPSFSLSLPPKWCTVENFLFLFFCLHVIIMVVFAQKSHVLMLSQVMWAKFALWIIPIIIITIRLLTQTPCERKCVLLHEQ